MNEEALAFWSRALKAAEIAQALVTMDTDSAASRAYYAALYALSAHFAQEGKTFSKHSALEVALHRDLIKPGTLAPEMGAAFTTLLQMRFKGDYGVMDHVPEEKAELAVAAALRFIQAVHKLHPDIFPREIKGPE